MYLYLKTKDNAINNRAVVLHVSVYVMFLVGILYFFFSSIEHLKTESRKQWFISVGIEQVI